MLRTSALSLLFAAGAIAQGGVTVTSNGTVNTCTVTALGGTQDDVPNILSAFSTCGTNARVVFPSSQYWIGTRLNPVLSNVEIDWHGTWLFSDNLNYWRNNSYPIAFQNHHAGFVLSGDNIRLNGYGTGGINGNGDVWYNAEQATTLPGRPMPFVWWNVSQVIVQDFFVIQPQLWSINIMNGTNMYFKNMYVNATATNAPYGVNWVQNTDGFDTMDAYNIEVDGLIYQGGDDCIAIKPRSYNINIRNVTCRGGNGIAIGSLGQYLEDSSVEDVQVDNVDIIRYNNDMENGAYIKTWMGGLVNQSGYESGYQPRGGGWGVVRNILFSNFRLQGPDTAGSISQSSGDNGSYAGTSLMEISNIAFVNFTGYTNYRSAKPNQISAISCSNVHPCYNIAYENFTISAGQNATAATAVTTCAYTAAYGVRGVNGCVDSVPACWRNLNCTGPLTAAFNGPWNSNIFAPATRNVAPKSILSYPSLTPSNYPGSPTIMGNGSKIVYDWGIEVGGIVSFTYNATGAGYLGIAFTEAKNYIGDWSDESNGGFGVGRDGAIYTNFTTGAHTYVMPDKFLRGGFRYMTIFLGTNDTTTNVNFGSVNVELDFQPTWSNLRAYQGYFHSNDELLNRIWYAGAYTLQTNAVPVNTGRWVPNIVNGWANNASLGGGQTIIVDGAKRDRAVWPGDMGIAVPSSFVSIGDLVSVANALQIMYVMQNPTTGAFPESGPPLSQLNSDTYHMWTMIGTFNYYLYSSDLTFLKLNWAKYLLAMNYVVQKIDPTLGLMNSTGTRDWARQSTGGVNTEANMILVQTLKTGASLATWLNNATLATTWTNLAQSLTTNINAKLWDAPFNSYKDNITVIPNMIHPQDANSMALLFNVVPDANVSLVATELVQNWTPIGAVTPELPDNISPFISSFELQGRLNKRDTARGLDLLRRTWGWIVNNPNSTQSTLIEGYTSNGSFGYRSYRGYGYDFSYTSHAHGWSSGPTSALTNYILGLDVTQPSGSSWTLAPQLGDLTSVEGGFTTNLGQFQASWTRSIQNINVIWNTPQGTNGTLTLPIYTGSTVYVNGQKLTIGTNSTMNSFLGEKTVTVAVAGGMGSAEVITTSSLGRRSFQG